MARHSIIVRIENGDIANKKAVRTLFTALKDGRYELQIDSANHRSLPQNKFYWGVCVDLIQRGFKDLGNDFSKEEVHEFLKSRFNYQEIVNEQTGQCERVPRSTAGLTTIEFMEYIAKIQQFAAEFLSLIIPDPGQQMMIEVD